MSLAAPNRWFRSVGSKAIVGAYCRSASGDETCRSSPFGGEKRPPCWPPDLDWISDKTSASSDAPFGFAVPEAFAQLEEVVPPFAELDEACGARHSATIEASERMVTAQILSSRSRRP